MTSSLDLKRSDITDHWVRQNYSLKHERTFITRKAGGCRLYAATPDYNKKLSLAEYLKGIKDGVREYRKQCKVPKNATSVVDRGYDYDGEPETVIRFEWRVPETDDQVIRRIMAREKSKITREKTKLKTAADKEKAERKEFNRLAKKFKKGKK